MARHPQRAMLLHVAAQHGPSPGGFVSETGSGFQGSSRPSFVPTRRRAGRECGPCSPRRTNCHSVVCIVRSIRSPRSGCTCYKASSGFALVFAMAPKTSLVASMNWSDVQRAIASGEAPAFLAAVRNELLSGRAHFGVLHSDLHANCFAEVFPLLDPLSSGHHNSRLSELDLNHSANAEAARELDSSATLQRQRRALRQRTDMLECTLAWCPTHVAWRVVAACAGTMQQSTQGPVAMHGCTTGVQVDA